MKYHYPGLPTDAYIYKHGFEVPMATNKNEFKLEEKSAVEHDRILGIWVQSPGKKAFSGKAIVNQTIFNSAYLTLVQEETNVVKKIPFAHIQACNDNGLPYHIDMGKVDMVESMIKIADFDELKINGADTSLYLVFDFVKNRHIK